jgi:hypothetical protein
LRGAAVAGGEEAVRVGPGGGYFAEEDHVAERVVCNLFDTISLADSS